VFTVEDFDLAEREFMLGKDREVFSEREGQNERPAIHGWSLAGVEGGARRKEEIKRDLGQREVCSGKRTGFTKK